MNGWTNHATWEVYTVISNTEWMYNTMHGRSAETIRDSYGDVEGVNWKEIAEALAE